ncbi:hypothetical protein K432DRAFT_426759 [Lepidopterella palustris CBS 459.81]|uniref:Peptidase M43 pregnancy-associated plasma-A domain-containing protein n=1 Tax=Lepidopterella palustris CBS 459.81 TaxID=1314670 RepID=A0A8E2E859_9PEZI|nr:hypothetical protein K432DRAFT_426759 [Lepidopterella palustris CBS 459.81]
MRTTKTLLLGLLAPLAVSAMVPCLNEGGLSYDPMNITAREAKQSLNMLNTRDTITVDLWIHLLVSGPTSADGYVDGTGILNQVAYLQKQYAPWGIQFQVKPISYALNADWAAGIDNDKAEKMRQLHRGDYKSLNIYLVEGATSGVCSLPIANSNPIGQTDLDGDGCFIPLKSGISSTDGTVAHEIGHWFGLLHVFEGGCTGTDYCDDTNAQAGPSYAHEATAGDLNSCPAGDSCPDQPGLDNVFNFMDYTDCAHKFTPCQGGRMITTFNNYRANRAIQAGVLWK